jgi:hypothetical protein
MKRSIIRRRMGPPGLVALSLVLAACRAGPARVSSPTAQEERESPSGRAAIGAVNPAPAPNAICILAGSDEVERSDNLTDIAYYYGLRLADSCSTSRLTQSLTDDQLADWINYLLNYSSALFDCGLVFSPLPGGIQQLGLSNTGVVGVPSPLLGPADAEVLIGLYLDVCATVLGVSQADLAEIRTRLEHAVAQSLDASVPPSLSVCPAR